MKRARVRAISQCGCMLSWVAVGCGPGAIDDGDGSGSAGSGSTTSLASTGASISSTVAPDPTTGDATTRGDTEADTGSTGPIDSTDGTETGEASCPPPEEVSVSFSVSPDETLSETCTVADMTSDPESTTLDLDCNGPDVTLVIDVTPAGRGPHVAVGNLVHIEHVVDQIFWSNRWLALSTAGGESDWLLVGAVEGSALDPPGTTLYAFFGGGSYGAPAVAEAEGVCMPVADDCGPHERLALDFTLEGFGTTRAFDHGTGFVDVLAFGWAYTVEEATQYPRPQVCDDLPPAWFDFAMIWFPSD